jgi:hypothetical protein
MDVVKLTDANFDKEVAKDDLVMVIKFSHDGTNASGGPNADARLSGEFNKAAADYKESSGLRLFEMDYQNSEVAKRYQIASATVLFVQQAQMLAGSSKDVIKAKIDRLLQGAAIS